MLRRYYTDAFLLPSNWSQGSYDSAFGGCVRHQAQAQQHLPALTAGTSAGDTYATIKPTKATIKTRVLLDARYRPFAVACTIVFNADAVKKAGGGTVVLVSQGQFILEKVGAGWKVTSFSVTRADRGRADATESGAAAPSGSAT